ncbi:MAG: SCP2 sterol-binding domain-containing protein [Candidatus Thermoplasmatota archaeon]|nr:SCP2 sterol-binding domain-containing protein [Candidatus Thermoplasmatota archaeon]MDA8143116.1 SCP2 sterol-binding domain-containing protein [Thermoplasmatales archaeon]
MNEAVILLLEKINRKLSESANLPKRFLEMKKVLLLDMGVVTVKFLISNGMVTVTEEPQEPEITIYASEQEIRDIMEKRSNPMDAYSKGRIRIKSSFVDKLILAELLS